MGNAGSVLNWLPADKQAAVCFSIDDVHPGTSMDAYEAGGDLGHGALGRVVRLQKTHPELRVTLFVTPNWRPLGLVARRSLLTRIPLLGARRHWSTLQQPNHLRVDRHPGFVDYINSLERIEVAMHGLHHSHPGPKLAVEFQEQSKAECARALSEGIRIFERAGLRYVPGFLPPAWNLPSALIEALCDSPFGFTGSARDLHTAVSPTSVTSGSGLQGMRLIHPQRLAGTEILHFPVNFQATSAARRALEIIECGGLLSIKAHIFKTGGGHTMTDGLDDLYENYLDLLFSTLEQRYGNALWWTTMGEISARVDDQC